MEKCFTYVIGNLENTGTNIMSKRGGGVENNKIGTK